jgi:hypothetical protein
MFLQNVGSQTDCWCFIPEDSNNRNYLEVYMLLDSYNGKCEWRNIFYDRDDEQAVYVSIRKNAFKFDCSKQIVYLEANSPAY